MNLRAISQVIWVTFALVIAPHAKSGEALRVHPDNPYILEFRGEPTVLRTFAEHYSSVLNEDFEFIPYLDSLKASGINLTRVFLAGFRVDEGAPTMDPLGPPAEKFLQPWPREEGGSPALDGLGKWDLSQWNEPYFDRLGEFLRACGERDIAVELTFFCTFYTELQWRASPFHPDNNVQGYGPLSRYDCMRPVDADLYRIQKDFVRKVVEDLNGFDHIYYEIQNEPFWNEIGIRDDEEVEFHREMLSVIRDTEAPLPKRHLVAHNFPHQIPALPDDFDIINAHYPKPVLNTPVLGAEALLRNHYDKRRILALDETDTQNATQLRLEAWMFLIGGGGIYNGLDYFNLIYTTQDEAGGSELGLAKRTAIRNVGQYLDDLDLVSLRRDQTWWESSIPQGGTLQAMASPGQQYAAYLHHGGSGGSFGLSYDPIDSEEKEISPTVTLEPGDWRAVWSRPEDLSVLATEEFSHAGGSRLLSPVRYRQDVALRIDRVGAGDRTPPPVPRGVTASARANGSIDIAWRPSNGADLSGYHVYRGTSEDFEVNQETRIAMLPPGSTTFNDVDVTLGSIYYYAVTAADLNDNESPPARRPSARAELRNVAFGGLVRSIPGIIMAEDFDEGGQDVAFNDLTPENLGGNYRMDESVDIEITTDESGDYHLVATEMGEWLKYSVTVERGGPYTLELRVANSDPGGKVSMEVDGVDVTGLIDIPATGGMDQWQTVLVSGIHLTQGSHVLRLLMVDHAPDAIVGHFNWMRFTHETPVPPIADAGPDGEWIDVDGDGFESVVLNAGASLPGDADIVSYEWIRDGNVIATGASTSVSLPVGSHEIELRVTDGRGFAASDVFVAKVNLLGLINGSFEDGLNGWTVTGNHELQRNLPYAPTHGAQLLSFNNGNSTPNGVLSQVVRTIPGQTYVLSFDMGALAYNTQSQRMQLDVAGQALIFSQSYSVAGLGGGRNRWIDVSVPFMATGATTTLTFRDTSMVTGSLDLILDNIRLVPRMTRSLKITTEPALSLVIDVSPSDDAGRGSGAGSFDRSFPNMTEVTVAAPSAGAGYRFVRWMKGGTELGTDPTVRMVMDSNIDLVAVYEEGPPTITKQPQGGGVRLGDRFVLSVEAVGTGSLGYQWRLNGETLPDGDTNTFIIEEVREVDLGAYDVVVSNAGGQVVSSTASIGVLTDTLVNGSFENGLDGWIPGGNLSIQSSLPYRVTDGEKLVAFNSGNNPPGGWISQSFSTIPGQVYRVSMDTGVLAYNTLEQRMEVSVSGGSLLATQSYVMRGQGNGSNTWVSRSFTFTADASSATIVFNDRSTQTNIIDLLLDNVKVVPMVMRSLVVESSPATGVAVAVAPADSLGRTGGVTNFSCAYLHGTIVTLSAPASADGYGFQSWTLDGQVASSSPTFSFTMDGDKTLGLVYAAGPPVITRQPVSVVLAAGSSVDFTVEAVSVAAMSYQWRFNGNDIPGANASVYSIPSVNEGSLGSYDVVVTSGMGTVTSSPASLQLAPPAIAGLTNGSFESGIEGWTVAGNQYVQTAASNPSVDGQKILIFNGGNSTPNGVVSQVFSTVSGQRYEVLFRMGVLAYNKLEQRLQVNVSGNSLIRTETFSMAGLGGGLVRWQEMSLSFTAHSGSTTLAFLDRSTTTNAIDLYLDHVRIRAQAGPQPMAASILVLRQSAASAVPPIVDPSLSTPRVEITPDEIRVTMSAPSMGWYHFERSGNLKRWEHVESRWAEASELLLFIDEPSVEGTMFYRVGMPADLGEP